MSQITWTVSNGHASLILTPLLTTDDSSQLNIRRERRDKIGLLAHLVLNNRDLCSGRSSVHWTTSCTAYVVLGRAIMQADPPAITVTMENGGQVAAEVPKVTLKFQCGLLRETETFTGEDVGILCRDTLLEFVCDMLTFKVHRRRLGRCVTT